MSFSWAAAEAVGTIGSIIVAIFFGLREARRARLQRQEAHTLSLFSISFSNEVLQKAASLINDYAGSSGTKPLASSDENLYFRALLSYYHFLSIAASYGKIDKNLLIVQKGSAIGRAYSVLKDWIAAERVTLKDLGYMKGLEEFVVGTVWPTLEREARRSNSFSARYANY